MKKQQGSVASIFLIGLIVLVLASFISYRSGYNTGEEFKSAEWEKERISFKDAALAAQLNHNQTIATNIANQNKTLLKNAYDYEIALKKVNTDLTAARAESKRLGGLLITIPTPTCKGDYVGAGTQTAGTSKRDEGTTTTVALPKEVESNLWSIVEEADQVTEQLRSCQAWIKDSGFYGTK